MPAHRLKCGCSFISLSRSLCALFRSRLHSELDRQLTSGKTTGMPPASTRCALAPGKFRLPLPVWPFCMTIMYEHKNVPYSPRCRQPKLPQFVAVYNLATHQSVCARQAKKKEKPLQTSQDNVVTLTKLEKSERMACAEQHFRFRLRFCHACVCVCLWPGYCLASG